MEKAHALPRFDNTVHKIIFHFDDGREIRLYNYDGQWGRDDEPEYKRFNQQFLDELWKFLGKWNLLYDNK